MRTVKLTVIKKDYLLIIPESVAKLYAFEKGQVFNLEVKERDNMQKMVFLTYATIVKD